MSGHDEPLSPTASAASRTATFATTSFWSTRRCSRVTSRISQQSSTDEADDMSGAT